MGLNTDPLEQWSNAFGPSGFEKEVAKLIRSHIQPFAEETTNDKLGSLIFKRGTQGPKIMIAGHMDEVGFLITGINKMGYISFAPIGGWFDQVLLGQRVIIKTRTNEKIMGIISAKPPHLLSSKEASRVVKKEKMFIDVGCKSQKEVENLGIQLGDAAVPDSVFRKVKRTQIIKNGNLEETREVTLAIGKAFDDRLGVFVIAEVLRRLKEESIEHPNQVYGVATTQEEIGLRGATTASNLIEPDIGFALEVDISGDVPGVDRTKAPAEMSKGVSIIVADASMLPNQALKNFVIDIAEELNIDHQLSLVLGGATDAGRMHLTGQGCPSLVITVPTRHIHSHNGIFDVADVEKTVELLIAIIKRLDTDTVASFTSI